MSKDKHILLIFTVLSVILDLIILDFLLLGFLMKDNDLQNAYSFPGMLVLLDIFWIMLVFIFRLNSFPRLQQRKKMAWNTSLALTVWFLIFFVIVLINNREIILTPGLLIILVLTPILVVSFKLALDTLTGFFRRKGYNPRNILVIGYSRKAEELKEYFSGSPWAGYQYLGFVHEGECPEKDRLGSDYDDIPRIVAEKQIDELFLNMAVIPAHLHRSIVSLANRLDLGISMIPDFGDFPSFRHNYHRFDQLPVITVGTDQLSGAVNTVIKRIFDVMLSLIIILAFLWWLTPVIALLIKLDSRGPVFFRQKRTGYRNKTFSCVKFRTMMENTEADSLQASEDDRRVTSFGRFLRRTSIDELPQFFNVLAGQMSVVGPRPHMLQHTELYSKQIPAYLYRHRFRPGITGLAQVRGFRGETREIESMKARIGQDIYYIENWSLWLDIKIILITLKNLIMGEKNAY